MVHACNPNHLGGWGMRITWTWEVEATASRMPLVKCHCTPAWVTQWDSVSKQQQQQKDKNTAGNQVEKQAKGGGLGWSLYFQQCPYHQMCLDSSKYQDLLLYPSRNKPLVFSRGEEFTKLDRAEKEVWNLNTYRLETSPPDGRFSPPLVTGMLLHPILKSFEALKT